MKEYIEREAAISTAIDAVDEWDGGPNRSRWEKINNAMEALPAADVREVVRCRECRHNKGQKEWTDGDITADCKCGMGYPPLDWFCAYGERRSADMRGAADGT